MIRHDFECLKCGAILEDQPVDSTNIDDIRCEECSQKMEVLYRTKTYKPFPAFTTSNIDGKPREITSLHQIRKLEKANEHKKLVWEPGSYNSLKYGDL